MADTDILQVIAEARVDARSLSEFVFKPANFIVSRRLAPPTNTLQFYIDKANSVNNAFSKSVSDATAAADIAIRAANTANQNAIGLINSVTNQATQSVENAIRDVAIDANLVTDALMTTVPINGTLGESRTQVDKNRESISILDFFTQSELNAYKLNSFAFDAARPVQAFFDYITANNVDVAYADGYYKTSVGITYNMVSKTTLIRGNFTISVLGNSQIHTLFHYAPGRERSWIGRITVEGNGGVYYTNRTCEVGLLVGGGEYHGGQHYASHNDITKIEASGGFKQIGVLLGNLTTASNFGQIQTTRCGSGNSYAAHYSLHTSFNNRVDVLSVGTSQQTTINVTKLPPANLITPLMAIAKGSKEIYFVKSVDRLSSTITLTPLLDTSIREGELRYFFGAGVYQIGGDASVCTIEKVSSTANSANYWCAALYPAIVKNLISESNCAGMVLGLSLSSAALGGQCSGFYAENNDYDFIRLTNSPVNYPILSSTAFNYSKVTVVAGLRHPDSNIRSRGHLKGVNIQTRGYIPDFQSFSDVSFNEKSNRVHIYGNTPNSIKILEPNIAECALYNSISKVFKVTSSFRPNDYQSIPNAPITFTAPVGYTINNGLPATFSDFYEVPEFFILLDTETKDITLHLLNNVNKKKLSKVIKYTDKTIGISETQTTTIPLIGAKVGNIVGVSVDKPLLGTMLWAEVSKEDEVTVYHQNNTDLEYNILDANISIYIVN